MRVLHWIGFALLLLPAGAGVLFAMMFAGFSVMGFDAPGSDKQVWPYLLVIGAGVALLGSAILVVYGVVLMIGGRPRAATLCLLPPAAMAFIFVFFLSRS